MDEKLIWKGRPSLWFATRSFFRIIKTIVYCAAFLYLVKEYLPVYEIPVPKIIPLPDFISIHGGAIFYILLWFLILFVFRVINFIKLVLNIICTDIHLTNEQISFREGIFNKFKKRIELYKIKDLSLYEPFFYRIMGLQNINIVAAEHTVRFPRLTAVPKKADLYELLSRLVEKAREKKGVQEVDYFNR
ncbi:MAG: PH domain-containing protein [Desulfobacteraceae bacterium]|nr:PH domain-containing protein [Desulfobacteraceae bacterium]